MQITCPECARRFDVKPLLSLPTFRVRCSECGTRAEMSAQDGRLIRRLSGSSSGATIAMKRPAGLGEERASDGASESTSTPAKAPSRSSTTTVTRPPPAYMARALGVQPRTDTPPPRRRPAPPRRKTRRIRLVDAPSGKRAAAPAAATPAAPVNSDAPEGSLPPPWHPEAPEDYGAWAEKPTTGVVKPSSPVVETQPDPTPDSTPVESSPEDAEVGAFRRELHAAHRRMMEQDPHALLGVHRGTSRPEVMRAYLALSDRWRPSRWEGRIPRDEVELVREVADRLDEAFNHLGSRERQDPTRHLTPPPVAARVKGLALPDVEPPSEEEMLFAEGKEAMAKGYYTEAVAAFRKCVRLDDSVALHHLRLGQAALRKESLERGEDTAPPAVDEVKPHFDRALELEPESIEVLLGYGHFLKARGQVSRAMRYFKEVRDQDPKHHEARREIRLYLSRKRRGGEPKTTAEKLKKILTQKI